MPYLDGLPIAASVSATDIIAVDQGGTPGLAGTATTRQTTLADILQLGPGPITGPGSSVNGDIVTFNGTTGRLLADGGKTIASISPSTAMRPVVQAATLALALEAFSTPTDPMFGVPAFGIGVAGNQNCIIGQVDNSLPPDTESFPTGVTGYGKVTTSGNQVFGVFGRADLSTIGAKGTAVNEFDSFNYAGDPNGQFPPNAGIGTDDYVAIAMQAAAYGTFPSKIGIGVMYGGVPAGGQPFKVGYYAAPGASQFYSMMLDASGSVGPTNGGALIRSTGVEPNLILQTQGLPTPANAVFEVIDHVGTVHAYINQAGQGLFAGTTTNDNAAAGKVGEFLSTNVPYGSAVPLTSTVTGNIAQRDLTAGDWDIYGNVILVAAAGTTMTSYQVAISGTSGTLPTPPNGGSYSVGQLAFSASGEQGVFAGQTRITLSAPATVYLVANCAFTVSSLTAYGFIGARRAR